MAMNTHPFLTKDSESNLQFLNTPSDIEWKMDGDHEGEFFGYAARYNIDQGGDKIMPGAFDATVKKRGTSVKLLYQHDTHQPIGTITAIEANNKGLKISAKLLLSVQKGREAYELMKAGILDSMSIGYSLGAKDFSYDGNIRILKQVDVREISVVTFPMNESARINRVKTDEYREVDFVNFFEEHGILHGADAITAAKAAVKSLNTPAGNDSVSDWAALDSLSQSFKKKGA